MAVSITHNIIKLKKILNVPTVKFLLGSTCGAGMIAASSALLSNLYNKNFINITKERVVNGVQLSVVDQIWILTNIILFEWENPLCWHNDFMQFLACPDIRRAKYDSDDIMTMIDFINDEFDNKNLAINDCLIGKVKIKMEKRRAPDVSKKSNEKTPKQALENRHASYSLLSYDGLVKCNFNGKTVADFFNAGNLIIDKLVNTCNVDPIDSWQETLKDNEFEFLDENNMKYKRIIAEFNRCPSKDKKGIITEYKPFFEKNNIFFMKKYGYYPTFISITDNVIYTSVPHIYSCYIVYNKNKEPKFFIWADGIQSKLEILSVKDSLEKLKIYKLINVVYSDSSIIDKYYIPI